jgi:hypothetical protein
MSPWSNSYVRANPATTGFPDFNANGGSASFVFNPRNWYGIAGEFSGYPIGQVGRVNVGTDLFTFMFGSSISITTAAFRLLPTSFSASPMAATSSESPDPTIPSRWRLVEAWTFRSGATCPCAPGRSTIS